MKLSSLILASVVVGPGAAIAQPVAAPPQNVLQLSADGTVEVQQDLLSMTLAATRDGVDPAAIQNQLKALLEAALTDARRSAEPGQMDVRTGNFSLSPRYNRDGKITGWQGSTELVLEGRDFPRITQAAGRITGMSVANLGFGLSREQRAKVEAEAQSAAIENFKRKADSLTRNFGFTAYSLREVSVNSSQGGMAMRPRMMAMEPSSKLASDSPVPVEAGKTTVVVNVSGSVQLR